jgi:hypothetical protein
LFSFVLSFIFYFLFFILDVLLCFVLFSYFNTKRLIRVFATVGLSLHAVGTDGMGHQLLEE